MQKKTKMNAKKVEISLII